MVLVRALVPEDLDGYLAQIGRSIDDPVYAAVIGRWSEAGDLAPIPYRTPPG